MKKVMFLSILFFSFLVFAEDDEEPKVYCENEAGHCTISRWGHECLCRTVDGYAQANGGGGIHGDYEVSEEVCKSDLESNCGKEKPTVRSKCGKKFDFCVTYVSESSRCTDNHMSEDEVIAAVDNEDAWNDTKRAVYYGCCAAYSASQSKLECLQEQCGEEFTDECCAECHITDTADTADTVDTDDGGDIVDTADTADTVDTADTDITDTADTGDNGDTEVISPAPEDDSADSTDTDDVDTANTDADDAANTETPATDSAPEDKADSNTAVPVTDEAPAENKEESKSDGCSMLFV